MRITVPFGSAIANEGPVSPEIDRFKNPLKTVADLMQILGKNHPSGFSTIQSTCAAWTVYTGKPLNEIPIEALFEKDIRKGFRPFLIGRGYTENTIRTYVDKIRVLAQSARDLSLASVKMPSPAPWRHVLELAEKRHCLDVALYFSRLKEPRQITIKDTDGLIKKWVDDGANYRPTNDKIVRFWRVLRDLKVNGESPKCLGEVPKFGVKFNDLPPDLKGDLMALLAWLVAKWSANRPDENRIRPITANGMKVTVCMLFGFALTAFPELTIRTVPQLFIEKVVEAYVKYSVNCREVDGHGVRKRLQTLCAAIRIYPDYQPTDLDWCKKLLNTLPKKADKDKIKERKRKTKVDHKYLRDIPGMIHAARRRVRSGSLHEALLVRDELLMKWLVYLPWRQRNIRLMKIGGECPNIFKGPIEGSFEKPAWVIEEERRNPNAEFWQIRFSKDETKMKHRVEALLPRALVPLLEEYYFTHRPLLIAGMVDPETLFVNERGKVLLANRATDLVQTLTLRYVGKAINPHRFRDLFAYAWLCDNPKDYLTLSKALWHRSVQETIDTYGAEFGIANGIAATEVWSEAWT